jgi:hypothetical protein
MWEVGKKKQLVGQKKGQRCVYNVCNTKLWKPTMIEK